MLGIVDETNPEGNNSKRRKLTSLKHLTNFNCMGRNQATSNRGELNFINQKTNEIGFFGYLSILLFLCTSNNNWVRFTHGL